MEVEGVKEVVDGVLAGWKNWAGTSVDDEDEEEIEDVDVDEDDVVGGT